MTKIYKCGSLASDNKDVNGLQLGFLFKFNLCVVG